VLREVDTAVLLGCDRHRSSSSVGFNGRILVERFAQPVGKQRH
jgi:hypothetical protein